MKKPTNITILLLSIITVFTSLNAQIFNDNRNCTFVQADNSGGNQVCVRKAPAPTGNANAIKNLLRDAGIPNKVLNSRLVNGEFANHMASLPALKETAESLASRRATYTGSGTVITQSNLEQNRNAIANNGGTFIFRGNVIVDAISKFIQVGSNTTIWIDGTVTYTGPQPPGTVPDQYSVSDVINGVFEVRGTNNGNRKNNVKFMGTKRGKIITNGRCAGVYTRFVRNLEVSGINFERCRNVLFINNTVDSKLIGNYIDNSERRAIHLKATNTVEVSKNLIFEEKVDGIDVDAFAKKSTVSKNVVCHTGDRFMIWTEIAVENTLVDQNIGLFMPNADRKALAFQENGSETSQPPTKDNTYSNNHVFYADLNKGNRGFVLNPRRRIVRESIVFENNYVWQSIERKLPYEDPKPNVRNDVYYYTPGDNNGGGGNNISVTGVNISDSNVVLNTNQTRDLDATVAPNNATNKAVSWSSNNTNVATVNNNGVVTAVSAGTATVTVTTTDGGFTATSRITVNGNNPPPPPPPPSGNDIVIEAETFTNTGGTFDDSFVPGGPGFGVNATANTINFVNSGDFAEYTINVGTAGEYNITYQISTPSDNAQIQLLIDGTVVATDDVPNNGDWDAYRAIVSSSTISNLSAGTHTVRVVASGSNPWQWNLDRITLSRVQGTPPPPPPSGNATLVIEAEDFVATGGTFDDAFAGGPGLGVNRGGTNINYVNNGDWAEYTVNVTTAGTYSIEYLISTPSDGSQIQLLVDGVVVSTTNVPNNGGWDSFTSLTSSDSVTLSAGSHTIRVVGSSDTTWQWNLDKITLSTGSVRDSGLDIIAQQLSLYPNPTNGIVTIQGLERDLTHTIRVFDIKGAQYLEKELSTNHTIDIASLPKGIYFLSVVNSEAKKSVKLIRN